MCICLCANIHTYMYAYNIMYVYVHIGICTNMNTYMYVYIIYICMYICLAGMVVLCNLRKHSSGGNNKRIYKTSWLTGLLL